MTARFPPLRAIGLTLLLALNVWLLAAAATALVSDGRPAADKVNWNFDRTELAATAGARKPLEAYGQTLARPIFFPSREPFVPAPPPPPPTPQFATAQVDPGLMLGGVMIKQGVKKAYVYSRAGPDGAWIGERDRFMGWELKSIGRGSAKLELQGRSIELHLYPPQ